MYERVHAVTYFAEDALAAAREVGDEGFFAFRAAALRPVGPAVVAPSFYSFATALVHRALPDARAYAGPERALDARLEGVRTVLERVWNCTGQAAAIDEAADLLWAAAEAADDSGRVIAAANQALPRPAEPHLALWQAATTLREQRGDGHVAALVAAGVRPVEALVLRVADGTVPEVNAIGLPLPSES